MAGASAIFPLLRSHDLFPIIMKIFEELSEDDDIRPFRLVSSAWRDFIDQILTNPVYRSRCHQHPVGMPLEERTALKRTTVQFNDGTFLIERPTILHSHKYVIVKPNDWQAIQGTPEFEDWHLFQKANVGPYLRYGGSIKKSHQHKGSRRNGRLFGMCQDSLFHLASKREMWTPHNRHPPAVLHSFKKEGDSWTSFQHPARHLWEQVGMEIYGLKEVAESQVFLFVFTPAQQLFQAISLADGGIKLSIKCDLPKDGAAATAVNGEPSDCFDMDVFGLVIRTASNMIRHFYLESKEETWQAEMPEDVLSLSSFSFKKDKNVTFLLHQKACYIYVFDNMMGTVMSRLEDGFNTLRNDGLIRCDPIPTQNGKYAIFVGCHSPAYKGIAVLNIAENKLEYIPVHDPITFCHLETGLPVIRVDTAIVKSETTMICILSYYKRSIFTTFRFAPRCVAVVHLAEPKRAILVSRDIDNDKIVDIVSNDLGYLVMAIGEEESPGPGLDKHIPLYSYRY